MNHGIPQPCDSTSSSEEEEEDASEEQQCDRVSEATSDYRAKHTAPSSMQLQQQQRDRTNETASNYYAKHTAPSGEQSLQQQRNRVSEAALNYHAKHTTPPSEQPVQQGTRVSEAALNYHAQHAALQVEQPVQYQRGRVGASVVSQRQPRRQTIATLPAEGEVNTAVDTSADDKVSPRGLSPRTRTLQGHSHDITPGDAAEHTHPATQGRVRTTAGGTTCA